MEMVVKVDEESVKRSESEWKKVRRKLGASCYASS